jgi:hypothetical protein
MNGSAVDDQDRQDPNDQYHVGSELPWRWADYDDDDDDDDDDEILVPKRTPNVSGSFAESFLVNRRRVIQTCPQVRESAEVVAFTAYDICSQTRLQASAPSRVDSLNAAVQLARREIGVKLGNAVRVHDGRNGTISSYREVAIAESNVVHRDGAKENDESSAALLGRTVDTLAREKEDLRFR